MRYIRCLLLIQCLSHSRCSKNGSYYCYSLHRAFPFTCVIYLIYNGSIIISQHTVPTSAEIDKLLPTKEHLPYLSEAKNVFLLLRKICLVGFAEKVQSRLSRVQQVGAQSGRGKRSVLCQNIQRPTQDQDPKWPPGNSSKLRFGLRSFILGIWPTWHRNKGLIITLKSLKSQ